MNDNTRVEKAHLEKHKDKYELVVDKAVDAKSGRVIDKNEASQIAGGLTQSEFDAAFVFGGMMYGCDPNNLSVWCYCQYLKMTGQAVPNECATVTQSSSTTTQYDSGNTYTGPKSGGGM